MPSFSAIFKAGDKSAIEGLTKGGGAALKLDKAGLKGASSLGTDALKAGGALGDTKSLLKGAGGAGDASKLVKGAGGAGDTKSLLKGADNAGGASKAAKGADNAGDASKAAKAKGADEAADAAKAEKNAPPLKTKDDASKSMQKWIKDNPKKAIAAAAGTAAIAYAADSYIATNGAKVGITKIEAGKDGGVLGVGAKDIAKITYTPELDILSADFITITGSDCSPTIDGTDIDVYKVPSKTEVWIKVSKALTAGGTKGQITLKTTPTARLADAVGSAAGSAVGAGADIAKEAGGGLLSGLGIDLPENFGLWLGVACIVLIIVFVIFKFVL